MNGFSKLSIISFLMLLLVGAVYFNSQVQFNSVSARWEINEDYQIREEIPGQIQIIEYTRTNIDNSIYDGNNSPSNTEGALNTNATDWASTSKMEIINNSIIIDDPYSRIFFWDSNDIFIGGFWNPLYSLGTYPGTGDISNIIPSNANYFAISVLKPYNAVFVPSSISYQALIDNELYVLGTYTVTQPAIDSYQVFENIRNDAPIINPLGFMDTIITIPQKMVTYTDTFFNWIGFSYKENILEPAAEVSSNLADDYKWYSDLFNWVRGFGEE